MVNLQQYLYYVKTNKLADQQLMDFKNLFGDWILHFRLQPSPSDIGCPTGEFSWFSLSISPASNFNSKGTLF